jgi:hypothetical protein
MTFYEDLYKEYVLNNKSTVEIYDTIKANNKVWLEDIFFDVMARLKYNIELLDLNDDYNKNDKVLDLLDIEYNETKNEKLYQIINHLKKYNDEKKLRIQKYREEEKFKEENPTPKEIIERINSKINEEKWNSIKKEIGYDYYDTYEEVINEVNQHDEYSDSERTIMLVKNSSQKVSNIFLQQIKKYMPKEYYHFKALVEKISPD